MKTDFIKVVGKSVSKNSPVILTGVSVAGLVTTTVLAVKATPKAMRLIQEEEDAKNRELTKKEVISTTWKCYIPAAVMGGVTIACIVGANSINLRRNAALASVYSLSEAALKEYQAKVVETIGEKKNQEIKDSIASDKIKNHKVSEKEVIITGKGDMLCYDALTGRYFKSDMEHIRRIFNELNRDLLNEMYISLNDVYYALNLSGTKLGDLVGWHVDNGFIEPAFSSQLTENGVPCLVLDFNIEPKHNYRD